DGRGGRRHRTADRRAGFASLMERFTRLDAVALPVARPNVDTDQIVPARYLQKPRSDNFGAYLFRDLRFLPHGRENPDSLLNRPAYRSARIVVAERNFG